jgi:hypothetical protein
VPKGPRTLIVAALAGGALLGGAGAAGAQLAPVPATAAPPRFHVEGIFDNVLTFEELHQKADEFLMNTARATLRVSGTLDPHLEYKAGVVGRLNSGTKIVDNVPFLSPDLRATILPDDPATGLPGTAIYLQNEIASDLYLQEAYATARAGRLYVRAGRQKVQSGTGYSYNPTDLINRRIPLDPTYEADGTDSVAVGWVFSTGRELQVLAAPRGAGTYRARLESSRPGLDLAVQYTSIVRSRVDWQEVNTVHGLEALDDGAIVDDFARAFRWHQAAVEFTRRLGGTRVYGEIGVAFIDQPDDPGTLADSSRTHERLLVGVDRTFDSRLRLIAEYMRIGEGRGPGGPMTLDDQMGLFKAETLSADENNVFLEISRPFARKTSGALKVLGMIDHPAYGLNPWFYYDPKASMRLAASLYYYLGTSGSSYSNVGLGAFGEFKYSF